MRASGSTSCTGPAKNKDQMGQPEPVTGPGEALLPAEWLAKLRCPRCRQDFHQSSPEALTCAGGHSYPVQKGVPRILGENAKIFSPHETRAPEADIDPEKNDPGYEDRRFGKDPEGHH